MSTCNECKHYYDTFSEACLTLDNQLLSAYLTHLNGQHRGVDTFAINIHLVFNVRDGKVTVRSEVDSFTPNQYQFGPPLPLQTHAYAQHMYAQGPFNIQDQAPHYHYPQQPVAGAAIPHPPGQNSLDINGMPVAPTFGPVPMPMPGPMNMNPLTDNNGNIIAAPVTPGAQIQARPHPHAHAQVHAGAAPVAPDTHVLTHLHAQAQAQAQAQSQSQAQAHAGATPRYRDIAPKPEGAHPYANLTAEQQRRLLLQRQQQMQQMQMQQQGGKICPPTSGCKTSAKRERERKATAETLGREGDGGSADGGAAVGVAKDTNDDAAPRNSCSSKRKKTTE